ncbi:MAG: hypothetical protein ACUZ8N_10810 [Candidatus Scalindua sp.]
MVTWDWWTNFDENRETAARKMENKLQSRSNQPRKTITTRKRIQTFGWRNTAKFYFQEFKNIFNILASVTILPVIPTRNSIQSGIAEQLNNINNPKDEKQRNIKRVEEPEEDSDVATKNYVDKLGVFTSSGDVVTNGYITVTDSNGTSRKLMTRA